MADTLIVADLNGNIRGPNRPALELLGYGIGKVVIRGWFSSPRHGMAQYKEPMHENSGRR